MLLKDSSRKMVQIIYDHKESNILVCAGKKVVHIPKTLNPDSVHETYLPENLQKLIPNPTENGKEVKINEIEPTILHAKISPNNNLLAITTSGGTKLLIIYKKSDKSGKYDNMASVRTIPRVSSALTFSNNSEHLLVCDKTGDCYLFDCNEELFTPGKWILGHLSIVYDVRFSPCNRYIVTCDRDEKIRITNFPNTHEIESYCLGHREFVSCIEFLENHQDYLVSLSGDKSLCLWKWLEAKRVKLFPLPNSGIRFCIRTVNINLYEISILVISSSENNVLVYSLNCLNDDNSTITLDTTYKLDNIFLDNICYLDDKNLLGTYNTKNLQIKCFNNEKFTSTLNEIINSCYEKEEFEFEDFSNWFKKKFDNVSEYLERKKRRIEEKDSNKRIL